MPTIRLTFTPSPRCGNCKGTGVFSKEGRPDEPCLYCLEDAVLDDEFTATIITTADPNDGEREPPVTPPPRGQQ
jgi:hypothetical protein